MAIIKQNMFVIRDTATNTLMKGARGQLGFESAGMARRSLVHAGWWDKYKYEAVLLELMPNSVAILLRKKELDIEYEKQHTADWRNIDQSLRDAIADVNRDISQWKGANHLTYSEAFRKIKFDKQNRYVVELLVSIETKGIT